MSNRRVPSGDPQEGPSFSDYGMLARSRDPRRRPRTPRDSRCPPTPSQRDRPFIDPNINRRINPIPEPRCNLFTTFNDIAAQPGPSSSGARYYAHVEDNSARVESPRAYQMRPDGPGSSFRVYDPRECPPTIQWECPVPDMRRYRSRSPRRPSRRLDFGGMDGMR